MLQIPWKHVHWTNSIFLIGTLLLTLTAVPAYIWHFGLDGFQIALFFAFFMATGLSVTLGYHRLFAHFAFRARWPVRLFTLIFGAAAFEGPALIWASDHRRHHKNVDHEDDPYNINKGFWHAHIGWILFKLKVEPPFDNVNDLRRDPLVMWQNRHVFLIGALAGLGLPAVLGGLWGGWAGALGGFLLAGVARVVCVQHMTFFINSLCHTIGERPYSSRCTARDSMVMALFTFGEGYHNFHHEFQHDYRNGVKPWHFDPTKWTVWLLHKAGMVDQLRRAPEEKVLLAEIAEKQRQVTLRLNERPDSGQGHSLLESAHERLQAAARDWEQCKKAYMIATQERLAASKEKLGDLKRDMELASQQMREALEHWRATYQMLLQQYQLARQSLG